MDYFVTMKVNTVPSDFDSEDISFHSSWSWCAIIYTVCVKLIK